MGIIDLKNYNYEEKSKNSQEIFTGAIYSVFSLWLRLFPRY